MNRKKCGNKYCGYEEVESNVEINIVDTKPSLGPNSNAKGNSIQRFLHNTFTASIQKIEFSGKIYKMTLCLSYYL